MSPAKGMVLITAPTIEVFPPMEAMKDSLMAPVILVKMVE